MPEIDEEVQELIVRLKDVEDRILSDDLIVSAINQSIESLKKLFGKNSQFPSVIENLKIQHNVEKLDAAIRKALQRRDLAIEKVKAATNISNIAINKSSILSNFLVQKGILSARKLRQFHDFFASVGVTIENALRQGDKEQVKAKLREFIEMLEKAEMFLKENVQEIAFDAKNAWSLHNLMAHEISHWLFNLLKAPERYFAALNEAYSFAIQELLHIYEENYDFNEQSLRKEAARLYRLIIPRKHVPEYEQYYCFLKPFVILIGIMILCDAIARKDKDIRNQQLLVESYNKQTFMQLYRLIEQALNNLSNKAFTSLLQDTLLKTAISQLKTCKEQVIAALEIDIENIKTFEQRRIRDWTMEKPQIITEPWKNLKTALLQGGIIYSNVRQVSASIELLRLMGYEDEARQYRDRYALLLESTLQKIMNQATVQEKTAYESEKQVVDSILAVIKGEKEEVKEIVEALAF